jgi:hypothetical protein
MQKSLRGFDAAAVAQLELAMWKAYYRHRFVRLSFLLLRLNREFFGFSYFRAMYGAYYAAIAAIDFRINKGRESKKVKDRVLKNLTRLYRSIEGNCIESFDYKKVAELELEWWLIDRYPSQDKTSREDSLANAMATMFNVESSSLADYSVYRAEAMVLCDMLDGKNDNKVDWGRVGNLLQKAYHSLYLSVQ